MAVRATRKLQQEGPVDARRRRLPAGERKRQMAAQAAGLLADKGFGVSTREIAAHLGVTQALIYRHFASKDALIAAALEDVFADSGFSAWAETMARDDIALADRIAAAYGAFAERASSTRMRLFVRAGLEGHALAGRRGAALTRGIFEPVIAALRRTAGLPDLAGKPMMRGERELAMMMHGAVVFLGIREHVYRMPMPQDRLAVVRLYAQTFTHGALQTLIALHQGSFGASMAVAQLATKTSTARQRRS